MNLIIQSNSQLDGRAAFLENSSSGLYLNLQMLEIEHLFIADPSVKPQLDIELHPQ